MPGSGDGVVDRTKARIQRLRRRYVAVDHLVAMAEHYTKVQGNVLAGAVTYFGFLSFFPLLALGFAVVGYVSVAYPPARDSMVVAIESIFPGIVSAEDAEGKISLADIEQAKAAAGLIGFLGVLYSGLNWVSGLRTALQDVFVIPEVRMPSFVAGKGIDLLALVVLGAVLIVSVGLSSLAQGVTGIVLDFVGLSAGGIGAVLVWVVGFVLGLAASTLLLFVMFRLLGEPRLPNRSLLQGALLGAVGFELLKLLVIYVLGGVGGSAFAPLAIAITLVVWINYFSRLVLFGACWAFTADRPGPRLVAAAEATAVPEVAVVGTALSTSGSVARTGADRTSTGGRRAASRFDAGSAVLGAAVGAVVAALLRGRD